MREIIAVEWYKLFRQSRTYVGISAIFVIEFLILISAYFEGATIIDLLLDNLKQTFYFEGELLNGNLLIYLILNTLWFHIPLIVMIITAGMLTSECKDDTLQSVMLQPVKKTSFLLSKYVLATLFTGLILLILIVSSFAFSYGFFGTGDLIVYFNSLSFYEPKEAFYRLIGSFLVGGISMLFFAVVSLTLAVFLKDSAKTWIIAAFFLIISNLLLTVDLGWDVLNSILFFKLNDTWQYFFYNEIPWDRIFKNTLLLIVYILGVIGIGVLRFKSRDVG